MTEKNIYYGVDSCSWKFDLSNKSDNPNAYFLEEAHAEAYGRLWPGFVEITKIENPKHLEFIVLEENSSKVLVSFRFESHYEKYLKGEFHD